MVSVQFMKAGAVNVNGFLTGGNLNFRCEGRVFINAKGCLRSVIV